MTSKLRLKIASSFLFLNFISGAHYPLESWDIKLFHPKCYSNNWTFLYSDYRFKDILCTYESNPSFIISMLDISSGRLSRVIDPSSTEKANFVLNLEQSDIRELSTGPFKISPVDQSKLNDLLTSIKDSTGSPLKFVIVPKSTSGKVINAFNTANVSVLYPPSNTVNHETDLDTFPLQDVVVVDLSQKGLDWILKMGKYLDRTEKNLFSLEECLNLTPPTRAQTREVMSTSAKFAEASRYRYLGGNTNIWNLKKATLLEDSVQKWKDLGANRLYAFLNGTRITFEGERGVDVGGLTKEWFSLVTEEGFGKDSKYFDTVETYSSYFLIPKRDVDVAEYDFIRFLGAFIAKVILNNANVTANFPDFILKMMMGKKANFHDLEQIQPNLFSSLRDTERLIKSGHCYETFSYIIELDDGRKIPVELKANGANIDVTEENVYEYIALRFKDIADTPQIREFVNVFRKYINERAMPLDMFKPEELRLLIRGLTEIDVEDWKRNAAYYGYNRSDDVITWFWNFVTSNNAETRLKLLRFITGRDTVPVGGFAALERQFTINRKHYDRLDNFPRPHTCFNSIDLPQYPDEELMHQKLMEAIEEREFGIA